MGLIEFLIIVVLVVFFCWLAVQALAYFAPGHPALFDKVIWGIGLFIVLLLLLQATGILNHDIRIPHV